MGGASNFPNRPFRLRDDTWVQSQDVANNRSLVRFDVWIDKTGTSPTWSGGGVAYSRWGYDGVVYAESNPGSFDFRGGGPWLVTSGSTWVNHNPDGTRTITVNVGADYTTLGATSYDYAFALPSIARTPPPAPSNIGLDQITRNSMRYRFSSNGDGGSPIIGWEVHWSASPTFSPESSVVSSGTTVVTNLKPGTTYYFRSRGRNAAGLGPYSPTISARTLSGAWISDGANWIPADVLISDGTTWKPGDVMISDGTTWKPAG